MAGPVRRSGEEIDMPNTIQIDCEELERLRADAGRYLYLRNQNIDDGFPRPGIFIGRIEIPNVQNAALSGEDADAAIDRAMSAPADDEQHDRTSGGEYDEEKRLDDRARARDQNAVK